MEKAKLRPDYRQVLTRLKSVNLWFLLFMIILAEFFTAIMNTVMGLVWWGKVSYDLIKIGVIDALVVSIIIGIIILYIYQLLLESEKKYSTLIEDAGDAICILSSSGQIISVNKKAELLSGYSRQELLGMSYEDFFPSEELPRLFSAFQEGLQNNVNEINNSLILRTDGSTVSVDITGSVMEFAGQKVIQTIIRDITERKKTEARLLEYQNHLEKLVNDRTNELSLAVKKLEQEMSLREGEQEKTKAALRMTYKIIENSPFGIYIVNSRGIIEYANTSMLIISGCSLDEFVGYNIYELPTYIAIGLPGKIRAAIDGRSFTFGPVTYTSHRGKKTTIRNFSGVPFQDGAEQKALIFVEDITELKKTETALRENEEIFRELFEQNEDALFLFHPRTCEIIDANSAAMRLYGYSKSELVGKDPSLFLDSTEHRDSLKSLCALDPTQNISIPHMLHRRKDGNTISVAIRGKVMKLQERDFLYCSFRDITEKLRLEEEARALQGKLIQANKMSSLGILVSGMAHEINNPNNFIMFNSQLLEDAWKDIVPILREYHQSHGDYVIGGFPFSEMNNVIPKLMSGISEGSHRIKYIIDNLKDFARQDRVRPERTLSMNNVITAAVAILGTQIKKNTDNFRMVLDQDLPSVKGSAQQLEQVIINLLLNALQSLPDRKQGVRVSTSFDKEKGCVIIQIIDEGAGMSKEVLERIMEPFYTTRLDEGGTGLGLSISYSIIKDHSGTVEITSTSGAGTTATVMLPAYCENSDT